MKTTQKITPSAIKSESDQKSDTLSMKMENLAASPGRWVLLPDEDVKHEPVSVLHPSLSSSPHLSVAATSAAPTLETLPLTQQRAFSVARLSGRNHGRSGGWENYSVRLVATGVLSSSAGGIVAQSFLLDPSNLPLSEWSTFASLFDEVRCTAFEVWLASYNANITIVTSTPLFVGSFTRTTATPTSSVSVAVAPDSVITTPLNTGKLGYRHVMNVPKDILFASTSSPAPGPYAGCPGSIQVYSSGNTVSTTLYEYMIVGRYALRGRL